MMQSPNEKYILKTKEKLTFKTYKQQHNDDDDGSR